MAKLSGSCRSCHQAFTPAKGLINAGCIGFVTTRYAIDDHPGGDGARLVDWVLRAYESDPAIGVRAKIVLGPFMETGFASDFQARAKKLDSVDLITFAASIEPLFERAEGIVAMGGYNTFCEVLSLDKRAIIVPRSVPRMEQTIRAERAAALGLVQMTPLDDDRDPEVMAAAIRALPRQKKPSDIVVPGLLEGLTNVNRLASPWLDREGKAPRSTIRKMV